MQALAVLRNVGISLLCAGLLSGCGGTIAPSGNGNPTLSGITNVTVLVSSKTNDLLAELHLGISGVTLKTDAGAQATLTAPTSVAPSPDFIHLAGSTESLFTGTIPQAVYTSAVVTVGSASFECLDFNPSVPGLQFSTFAYNGGVPAAQVAANVLTPLTVTGGTLGLNLNLNVAESFTFAGCNTPSPNPFLISPTFSLSIIALGGTAAPSAKMIPGIIGSTGSMGSSFTLTTPDALAFTIATNATTAFQGVGAAANLAVGMAAFVDATVQSDGSLLATRVVVPDTNASNLSIVSGPILFVSNVLPLVEVTSLQAQGPLFNMYFGGSATEVPFSFVNAGFSVLAPPANLQSLPFSPVFSAGTMVAGQQVAIVSHATSIASGPSYYVASSVQLLPQSVNGVIQSVSTSGNFTVYTFGLPSYQLLPDLATQAGQTTILTNPKQVTVYVDSAAAATHSGLLAAGSYVRFTGYVFNDGGTLKMDATAIADGLAP